MYAVYHGPKGLTQIANRTHHLTAILAKGLSALGLNVEQANFFDTLTLATGASHRRAARSRRACPADQPARGRR
jgi:glycine dehydrogenase